MFICYFLKDNNGRLGTNRDMRNSLLILIMWYVNSRRRYLGHDSIYQSAWFEQEFTDYQFYKCFRLTKQAVQHIENRITVDYKGSIPIRKALLLTLWIIGQDISYRCAEETIGISYSAICKMFNHVVLLIVESLGDAIDYNRTQAYYEAQCIRFGQTYGVDNVCCVMDGTLIQTRKPKIDGQTYYSGYKKSYGISVLCVSSIDKEILFVSAGYPGSTHDSAVLRASPLWRDATRGILPISANMRILGDSAFPDEDWIVVSTEDISSYCSPRTISEHVFARLKGKFRILDGTVRQHIDNVAQLVVCCCILSNVDLQFPAQH